MNTLFTAKNVRFRRGEMRRRLLCLIAIFILSATARAQVFTVDPGANFSWPPPVYVLRGEFTLYGTANLDNMASYFIEYRRLNDDITANEDGLWLPATLPRASHVIDDALGVWDTTVVPDGPYELRMTINVTSGNPVFVILSPLRVENTPSPFVVAPTPEATLAPTGTPPPPPTLQPTPTPFDLTPRVEAVTNANVRSGDGLNYPVISALLVGETAPITGISTTGSGWYQIELPNGGRGWISPAVARATGEMRDVPRIAPPPPPPPTATPTPATQANLVVQSITLSPDPPRCNQTFTITARVANMGSGSTDSGGSISVQDVYIGTGSVTGTTSGAFPPLGPGQTFDAVMRLTVDTYYNEGHRLTLVVDSASQVTETNEGDNAGIREYTLARANCG